MPFILRIWLFNTVSFLIVYKLSARVNINSNDKVVIFAMLIRAFNTILLFLLKSWLKFVFKTSIDFSLIVFTHGISVFILNGIILGLIIALVPSLRCRQGFLSAGLGAIALAVINSILIGIMSPIA